MPRVIGEGVLNQVDISDAIGGGEVRLFYRTPTTRERAAYQAKAIQVGGRKMKAKLKLSEARLEFGAKILEGVREGDVLLKTAAGEAPLTSETSGWRDKMAQYAPDLVEALAAHVFEGTSALEPEDEEDPDESGE